MVTERIIERDTITLEFSEPSITGKELIKLTKNYIPEGWFIDWVGFSLCEDIFIKVSPERPLARLFTFPIVKVTEVYDE